MSIARVARACSIVNTSCAMADQTLWFSGMPQVALVALLEAQPDFREAKTLVEEEMEAKGAKVLFLPKNHPELNPMEFHYRDIASRNRKLNITGSSKGFVSRVLDSYSEVTPQRTRKYFLSVEKFANIYSDGLSGSEAFKQMTLARKSHRHFGGVAPSPPDHKKKRYSRDRFPAVNDEGGDGVVEVEEEWREEETREEEGDGEGGRRSTYRDSQEWGRGWCRLAMEELGWGAGWRAGAQEEVTMGAGGRREEGGDGEQWREEEGDSGEWREEKGGGE